MSDERGSGSDLPVKAGTVIVQEAVESQARGGGDDVLLRDCVHAVYRRRWLVVGVIAACVGAAAIYNFVATPIYEARARLLIEPSSARVVTFRPVVEEEQGNLEYYQTQY